MESAPARLRLLDSAATLFLHHGIDAVSMDQIRQHAGVSNGSLYHHFPGKPQLADALCAHTLRDFHGSMLAAVGPRRDAHAGVTGLVRAYVQWVEAHPASARLLHELRRGGAVRVPASPTDALPAAAGAGTATPGAGGETAQANADGFGLLRACTQAHTDAGRMRSLPFAVWMALVFSPAMALTPRWVGRAMPGDRVRVPARERAALEHAAWMAVAA